MTKPINHSFLIKDSESIRMAESIQSSTYTTSHIENNTDNKYDGIHHSEAWKRFKSVLEINRKLKVTQGIYFVEIPAGFWDQIDSISRIEMIV